MPTQQERNARNRRRMQRQCTVVTSVDGMPLEVYAPGLANQFSSYYEAYHAIMKHTGKPIQKLRTIRSLCVKAELKKSA